MSAGFNKVLLLGNLGADAELKILTGGQSLLKFRIATTEVYYDKNNQKQERTEWNMCTLWGKRAEGLAKYLHKGDRVFIEGSLRTSKYEKDGQTHYRTDINVNNLLFAGGKKGEEREERESPRSGPGGGGGASPPPQDDFGDYGGLDGGDDIPFIMNATMSGKWWKP